ncbi:AT-rich interactive domain-containing protein 2 isoform X13 [Spodoptera litura]|uniref:AT-rich interactive domain-containing protein 2 isoform X13 n=1 Tax=Spodoptera litura TaxID=69820 RepID=A0A9J7IU77_SPOLT|nr:AT-rich interactive domain-containing protein 2 isoform X13 [Spodoptera litura]
MAKAQINTKSSNYIKDRESFMKELKQFNESKNLPTKVPIVNGIELDLYLFYTLVQQRGGLGKVNQNDTWESFLRPLRLPHPCINGSTLLRRIYGTYLEKYERAKGPPGRDDDNDMDEDPRRGRGAMPRISFAGGTYISASGEALRTGSRVAAASERLALSLLSPMPNEQDFAVNVCTVLAADHSNRLPLSSTPHILDFLLAHAGVYNHSSLRDTIGRSYYEARGRYPDDFWRLKAGGGGVKELADETKFMQPGVELPELIVQARAAYNTLTDCLLSGPEEEEPVVEKVYDDVSGDVLEDWMADPSEDDLLFAPELPGGASCVYTQRVLQIASIVRSLSFHDENVQYLAKNSTLLRFLLLCANSWVGSLRQSGLDTLGNVSTELIIKDPATCLITRHVLSTIQAALVSQDRARVLAALELLNKLAQNELNEDALLKSLEAKVYADVCALLSLRDIMVLVCTLECVYALTSLGDRASEAVARVPGLIHTLVSLVTVEAQSYGPRACILMRVVETVSGPSALQAQQPAQHAQQHAQLAQHTPHAQTDQHDRPPQLHHTSQTPTKSSEASGAAPAVAPASSLQQSHLQQRTVQENEHFAQAWLRSAYEVLPAGDNSACEAGDVYRQYLACCTKLARKGLIAPAHFPRLVRTVFGGTVGPNTVTLSTGETQQVYIGIRSRALQNRPNPPAGPSSPILKAQLTNKAAAEAKPAVSQPQTQPQAPPTTTHPHLSQALESTPSNTTLIKHLLAHKVSPALQPQQVAQRQQSQQRAPPTATPTTVVVQNNQQQVMDVDPEALIKCTTITPGGVASSTPTDKVHAPVEEPIVPKEEPVQIQIDEQTQLTIKSAQNKMLADLLKKNSNPPLQVVQMGPQINAPTIQITETGQIVQVKSDPTPVIQINDSSLVAPGNQYFQIKNEQGQLIQIKNEQGQIIQLKSDQLQAPILQYKNEQGQLVQVKTEGQVQIKPEKEEVPSTDHSYNEPPAKKSKVEEKAPLPQESVSKTAANLYAALAASALEDEEDLRPHGLLLGALRAKLPPKQDPVEIIQPSVLVSTTGDNSVIIQEPMLQVQPPPLTVQQPTLQVHQPTLQVQQPTLQVQAPTLQQTIQVQQPMLQVQPMEVQNIIASQAGQLILQEKSISSQPTQFVQQPMQIIATPSNAQGGISYIAQNIPGNMMQKTIIIVQGPTGGGPLTLTNTPQITPSQQPIITNQPQPHKAQIINPQQTQQIVVTQKQPPALISTSSSSQIVTSTAQIIQGNQQLLQGSQQIIAVSNTQPIIMNTPMKTNVHRVVQQPQRSPVVTSVQSNQVSVVSEAKTSVIQSPKTATQPVMRQVIRQPVMVGNTKIGDKELVVNQPVAEPPKPPTPKPSPTPPPAPAPQPAQATSPQDETPWICHWRGCGKTFSNATQVFFHAARSHCPTSADGEAPCMWLDCDRVPRKTFALLNHLTDKHCSMQALTAVYYSRRHAAGEGADGKPVALNYPPNAALAALNKHAADMFNPRELMHRAELGRTPEQLDENEGPVTKSIRLTAALILRNIVIYSNTGRRQLRSYESHLATIALSSVEASRTIAQVLYDMNNI